MGVTKGSDDRKDKTIQIRVTADQYNLIKRTADEAHLELSAFVRQLVLVAAHQRTGAKRKRRERRSSPDEETVVEDRPRKTVLKLVE